MGRTLTDVFRSILRNWDTLLCFEIVYRAIGYYYLFPYVRYRLETLPSLLGIPYLGQENAALILGSPWALILVIEVFVVLTFYILFEIVALFLYCEEGWQCRRISFWGIWKQGILRTAGLFRPKRIAVLLLALPMLLSVLSLTSGWLPAFRLPEFILEYILESPGLALLYGVGIVGCNLLLFRYLFGLPAMLLDQTSYLESWSESRRLLLGKGVKTFAFLFLAACILIAVLILVFIGAVLLLVGEAKLLHPPDQARALFQFHLITLRQTGAILTGAAASVFLCGVILGLYHKYRGEGRRRLPSRGGKKGLYNALKRTAAVLFTIFVLLLAGETELGGNIPMNMGTEPQIIAHRAGGLFAPENTVAALERAIDDGADQAEIDVQQLRDGMLVVLHDANFRRTTGENLYVWNADQEDVKALDAGSHYSFVYKGEPVPSLEDMLDAASGRIRVMIELKASGHETGFVQEVLTLIKEKGMEGQCSIASMDLGLLKETKALMPEMETVYISAFLISNRYDIPYVDCYSVETSSLSRETVAHVHGEDKQVFGWTANSIRTLDKLIQYGVDGLVTDNVALAEYCMMTRGRDLLVDDLTDLFF